MLRCFRTVLGLALVLSVFPATAPAQWGWGWGGWGGWAQTPGGALAQGLGCLQHAVPVFTIEKPPSRTRSTPTP